jgi:transposase, IS30 family
LTRRFQAVSAKGLGESIVRQVSRRPVRRDGWVPGPGRLTLADREEITLGLRGGESFTVIAARLGKAVSTVWREVAVNGGRDGYRAWRAHQRARQQARRPRACKLASPELAAQVTSWLGQWWSPQQIGRRLRIEFPGDPMMHVSHETIYQALYVQGRGELRRELARCLRTGWAKRRPRGRDCRSGHIKGIVMISDRPAEADDRAVPGRWEGDLIIGKDCKSAVGTLVERTTRYLLLLHLPAGRDAHLVEQAMRQAITTLPGELARTITWDQGIEMAGPPRRLHHRHRHPDLLLRPAQGLPARLEQEHQRAAPPVPAQRHRRLTQAAANDTSSPV